MSHSLRLISSYGLKSKAEDEQPENYLERGSIAKSRHNSETPFFKSPTTVLHTGQLTLDRARSLSGTSRRTPPTLLSGSRMSFLTLRVSTDAVQPALGTKLTVTCMIVQYQNASGLPTAESTFPAAPSSA